jgi:toxin-antitoxin system PIN domain toxin
MRVSLLDINVLLALFDDGHRHHEDAHRWFARNRGEGWATCALTTSGCVRVLSNPAYPAEAVNPAEVVSRLRRFCSAPDHHWWPSDVSILDERLFRADEIVGHRQVSDVYLLGLAVRFHGRLVTYDRSIPLHAVIGATARSLVVLGGA